MSRSRRLSAPTRYTWSGLSDIMGAALWVAAWVLGIAIAVGVTVVVVVSLFRWLVD